MAANAINLDEIDLPTGIEASDGIVISLPCRLARVDPVIVEIPGTGIRSIGSIPGLIVCAFNREIPLSRLFRNPAKNVDAQPEAETVNIIG